MKIKRILNNNFVIAEEQSNGQEIVVMSVGLGFRKKIGDSFDQKDIQKIFVLPDELYRKYKALMDNVDPMAMEIAEEIISYATEEKNLKLNNLIHITLTDHIDGVISRLKKGVRLANQLTLEISRVYSTEFSIGLFANHLIETKTGLPPLRDEAAFIAMNILNSRLDMNTSEVSTQQTTEFIEDNIKIVENYYHQLFDKSSFSYYHFTIYLKDLSYKIYTNNMTQDDDILYHAISSTYPTASDCADKIANTIRLKYRQWISTEEKSYLALHIQKLTQR